MSDVGKVRSSAWGAEQANNVVDGVLVCEPFIAGDRQGSANLKLAFEPELYQRTAHDRGEAGRQVIADKASVLGALHEGDDRAASFARSGRRVHPAGRPTAARG